jgi:AcrR family transcriptional regulator
MIAEGAGITEAVLYQHFSSKEQLFEASVLIPLEEEMAAMCKRIAAIALEREEESRLVVLQRLELELLKSMERVLPLFGVAIFSDRQMGEQAYLERVVRPLEGSALAVMSRRLGWDESGKEEGTIITLWISMAIGLVIDASFSGKKPNWTKVANQLSGFLLYGLSAPPPLPRKASTTSPAKEAGANRRARARPASQPRSTGASKRGGDASKL